MTRQIELTRALPKTKRNIQKREGKKSPEIIAASMEFGELYFDGPRSHGYGGYKYDGRWLPVAKDIIDHFSLKPGMRILDVGCAKGYLVRDILATLPGIEVFGLDISRYALNHCHPEVVGRLHLGNCVDLPFPSGSFDAAISLDTIHNLPREHVKIALSELSRVAGKNTFVKVDSYHTLEQKEAFESWMLTAKYHDYPDGWLALFEEAEYDGFYDWTIIDS